MKFAVACLMVLVPVAAMAELTSTRGSAPSQDCIGQSIACVTAILGAPSEKHDYADMMEYHELHMKYGGYFNNTPQGNTRYSGELQDGNGGVLRDSEAYYFYRPLVHPKTGAPFRVACDFTVIFMPKADRVVISGSNCGACMRAPLHLSDLANGDDKSCRIHDMAP